MGGSSTDPRVHGAPAVAASSPTRAVRWRPTLAAIGWTAAVGISTFGLLLWARSGYAPLPQGFMSPLGFVALVSMVVTQATAGLILVVRRPANPIGLIILAFALAISLAALANGYVALAETGAAVPIDPAWLAAITSAIAFSVGTLVAVILGMVFPDGRLLSPVWRLVVVASVIGALSMALGLVFTPGPLLLLPGIDAPIPAGQMPSWIGVTRDLIGPVLLTLGAIASGTALVIRYRHADVLERLQLRWYLWSGVLLATGFVAYIIAIYLPAGEVVGRIVLDLFYLSASIPPVAIVFAILRYNLYGIDSILGRTFVYGALTAILAGLYTASVRLFNALFVGVAGESSELVLVITTLILATTFTPIKRRLETIVEHRMSPDPNRVVGEHPTAGDGQSVAEGRPMSEGDGTGVGAAPAAAWFEDPAFVSAVRDQIRIVLAERPDDRADST